MSYLAAIGLEIHVQLKTESKLFCSCSAAWTEKQNENVCRVCLGHPGTLPRLNRLAVRQAVKTCLAMGMEVEKEIRFSRKHYTYPDLSKQYQTSQFYTYFGTGGSLSAEVRLRKVSAGLFEAHLEEDAARLVHAGDESMVDYNRGGHPLLEIVTRPELHAGEEAEAIIRNLQTMLRTLDTSEANMELGQLRCDVNVSVAHRGEELGTKVEIKNLNSPRHVRLAIEHEFERQVEVIEKGAVIRQETRLWNENRGLTEAMRSKEMSHDYRYIPEPDLAVVRITEDLVNEIGGSLPELPQARAERFREQYGLNRLTSDELVAEWEVAEYYEKCVDSVGHPDLVAAWMLNQLRTLSNEKALPLTELNISPERLAELLSLVAEERLSPTNAKKVLAMMVDSSQSPEEIMLAHNLEQISDRARLSEWAGQAIASNPEAVESYLGGKKKAFQFLAGQVMKASRGQANPRLAREQILEQLKVRPVALVDMGGAITGVRDVDGSISEGGDEVLASLARRLSRDLEGLRLERFLVTHQLSENLSYREWFSLWSIMYELLNEHEHKGLVVAHGLDTLTYSASLMRWLLPCDSAPVVFTGTVNQPDGEDDEAYTNLKVALDLVENRLKSGVWMSFGGKLYPAVNMQMIGIGEDVFAQRNLPGSEAELAAYACGTSRMPKPDLDELHQAVRRTLVVKIYPGQDLFWIEAAVQSGVKYLLLELFDTGTANTRRDSSESLLPVIRMMRDLGGAVFCTSQIGIPIDMSSYASSRDLWNAGVIPLGGLVTQSAYTKLIAAQIHFDSQEEVVKRMMSEEYRI